MKLIPKALLGIPVWYNPPEVSIQDNTRYVRPIADTEVDRMKGLPEGTTTMRKAIEAQKGRQLPTIGLDKLSDEAHKSINREVKKALTALKVHDVANTVAAVTSIPATIVAPEVMTPIFAIQGAKDASDVLSKKEKLTPRDYDRLGLDALFMFPAAKLAGNYFRFNTNLGRSIELSRGIKDAAKYTSEPTEEELRSVFSDIRKQEELNAVASGSTNSEGNLYFKQGVDYTVRPLLKETLEVIDLQIAPRLFGLRLSLMKLPVNDGYFRGSIDLVKKKTRVSEWNPEMISEYNRLNNESAGGWSLPDKPYIVIGKSDFRPTAQTEVHEARHQIQKSIKPTLEESKILKLAYGDVPRPSNPNGSVKPGYENYDMSVEYETMNAEARKVLLDKAGYKYDSNLSPEQNLEIQNKLLDNLSEKDIASVLIDSRTGYWTDYIGQLTKNYDGPLESWVKTDEGKKKIHDWIKAMKYVGVSAGIIGTAKHSKGGKLKLITR